jgi:antitoxin (DNA-binding transcriptional repressor) of toxin-antitoxin stability system
MSCTKKPGAKTPKRSTKPTIVKVHAAKTHLSRLLQRVAHGGRVLIANGNQDPRFELVLLQPGPQQHATRQFGALRGAVTVDQRFFETLPAAELEAWER